MCLLFITNQGDRKKRRQLIFLSKWFRQFPLIFYLPLFTKFMNLHSLWWRRFNRHLEILLLFKVSMIFVAMQFIHKVEEINSPFNASVLKTNINIITWKQNIKAANICNFQMIVFFVLFCLFCLFQCK